MTDNPNPEFDEVRELVDGMIRAVRVLQRSKMVHRDVKPENFIINRDGHITLIDLGTVQISGVKEIMRPNFEELPVGDVGYIAPEYLIHDTATALSDLFSIASIAYEMLAGQLPFDVIKTNRNYPKSFSSWGYTPLKQLNAQRDDIPPWVDNVLKKALAARPENRYQAMSEFQTNLRTPSKDVLKPKEFVPLIERNPLRFWKIISLILCIIIIAQWISFAL